MKTVSAFCNGLTLFGSLIILFIIGTFVACSKDEHDEIINDATQYYVNYNPDLEYSNVGNYPIDINNDGIAELRFEKSYNSIGVVALTDSVKISCGVFTGSGSSMLDRILLNAEIDEDLEWYHSFQILDIYMGTNYNGLIEYIGVRTQQNNTITYGWIYLKTIDNKLIVKEVYYRKQNDLTIKAGVHSY